MQLIIHFSAREGGNCDGIAAHIAKPGDHIVRFRNMEAHACSRCAYECFSGPCRYRDDGVYDLYRQMMAADRVVLVVPMYCGNPSSLYFAFTERGQDFFMEHGEQDAELARKLYIIGVYGSAAESPDFLRVFAPWFGREKEHILGLERRVYGQRMGDLLLDVPEVRGRIERFLS